MGTGLVNQPSFFTPSPPGPERGIAGSPTLARVAGTVGAGRSRRSEYLLVIYPHGELQDKLLEEQQRFSSDYGMQMTVRNKPHITVAAFQAGEAMENTLIRWIQRICGRHRSFEMTLNNYSGFPPHTIYLRILDQQPFLQLAQQLSAIDDFIRSSGCPPVNLIGRPYLSIAGSLTEKVYSKAMPDYSRKTFHGSFQVNELVLLKREHAFDSCTTVNIFHLLPELHQPCS
ncbi:MAG: 2'-5' RNA ligase family protein [Bacteroidota bacterium]|nr:2'-5' RNA ligase family protein [Bacteroidota bacterium]MDP4244436.1 2'-5' RNA ligase family protein [Bacteroidota bacterium]MDP4255638.1 2'-5' RNA ligase family protein [Bacteroidota bacterium]MDP4260355.1 2'-5' RNA ligase family protein [Bacteroidota bacterium]